VADSKELKAIKEASKRFLEELRKDPVKLRKFLRDISGPEQRIITGQEREHLFTVFNLIEPTSDSNNQRTWTTVYHHAGKEYHYTVGEEFDELVEILPDDFQQDKAT
jgi:hypothetical protein